MAETTIQKYRLLCSQSLMSAVAAGPDSCVGKLAAKGWEVVSFGSCEDGIRAAASPSIDAAVVDTTGWGRYELENFLRELVAHLGSFVTSRVVLVTDELLNVEWMQTVYESAIESTVLRAAWEKNVRVLIDTLIAPLRPAYSLDLQSGLAYCRAGLHAPIQAWIKGFAREDSVNFEEQFVLGVALETLGKYEGAAKAFQYCVELNRHFVPALSHLGNCLALQGQTEAAIELLESLEQKFPGNTDRRAALTASYMDRKDYDRAVAMAHTLSGVQGNDPRAIEAQVLVAIHGKDLPKVSDLLDRMEKGVGAGAGGAGQALASRLNDLAIDLAKAGDTKAALALYDRTHRIVRPDLKYKISLNIALTYLKTAQPEKSTTILDRCEKEYGGTFDKLEKMRAAIGSGKAA